MKHSLPFGVLFLIALVSLYFGLSSSDVKKLETLLSTSLITQSTQTKSTLGDSSGSNQVTKVVDGDTVKVMIDGKIETIRLLGIDTPEVVDPRKPVQCFGKKASEKTKELLTGKSVLLESDPTQGDRDRYGRLLRYVYLEDGTLINDVLVRQGFAHEYTYQSKPYKYQQQFIDAEREAREQKKGLWADGACSE